MKDLRKDPILQRYRQEPLPEVKSLFQKLSDTCKLHEFAFPLKEEVIKTLISEDPRMYTQISVSIQSSDKIRPISVPEIYLLKNFLLNPEESLVWTYRAEQDQKRSSGFRNVTGNNFDMTDLVIQLMEFTEEMPPLEEAYKKKVRKNKGFFYSRGTIGSWKFIHISLPGTEPWILLKEIADREFKKSKSVFLLFNEETKKHPYEYILWVD